MNIKDLIAENDTFHHWHSNLLTKRQGDLLVVNRLLFHTERYINFYNFSAEFINDSYWNFLSNYISDIEAFQKMKKYPHLLNIGSFEIQRTVYDLVLMMSTIFTEHRYRIMEIVYWKSSLVENALIVGLGSGIEVDLILHKTKKITAYDVSVSDFCKQILINVDIRQTYLSGDCNERFDRIYLIEILEHLANPVELLYNCSKVLNTDGEIFLTTATDIPQFDHLYNFIDLGLFEQQIRDLGLAVVYKEDIYHEISFDIQSKNTFYILRWQRD